MQVTGPDGLEEKGDKEVVLKDVWLDKGSQMEKDNQEAIRTKLRSIKDQKQDWLRDNFQKRVDNALENIPDSLPFMRILHDTMGMDCKDCLPSAEPDRPILSRPQHLVSSSKNATLSTTQNEISYFATPDLVGRSQRQYKVKTQYRLVYAEVGYPLHDVRSIDKAFHAMSDVLTGDKISSFAQYCLC